MKYRLKAVVFAFIVTTSAQFLFAQQNVLPAYQPSRVEMMERYRQVLGLDSTARNTVFKANVHANWQLGGNSFWYRNLLKDSVPEYIYVDALKGIKQKAFDNEKMAVALSKASGQTIEPAHLQINNIWFSKDAKQVTVEMKGKWWQCNLSDYSVTSISTAPKDTSHYPSLMRQRGRWEDFRSDSISPDKQWVAYIKDGNVFVKAAEGNDIIQFTTDGTIDKPYGSLAWAPDNKYLVGYHISPVTDSPVYYVLSSMPNTTRGQLRSNKYKQPGDGFTTYEMYLFNMDQRKPIHVNTQIIDFFGAPVLHWRKDDPQYFTYEKVDRGHQRFRIIEVDAATAGTRNIVDEQTNTFIYEQRIFTYYMSTTNEIVWISEKDGWRQIYLVDAVAGKIKNRITNGEWVVRDIDSVDERKREIWFHACGMDSGEDPYHIHYYRIGFDGTSLIKLTEGDANHQLVFSPDKRFYLDTYSKVNVPPIIDLRRTSDGKKIMEIERADISAFRATGIRLPEIFHAKGRDGKTEIWGIVCRPRNFDSTKRYPVIENIYAGPQDSYVPKNFTPYSEMQGMAELGFIVVQIDGMGTANRSKAFHDVCWKNLADAGFADRIAWMKSLSNKYPYVDITKVGVYGTSAGGQNSMGALLFHPEFYKAAVSSCGCHDNRIDKQWWNEQWMGYPVGKHYDEQSNITNAYKLQGDVLLMVGEADTNVPPESTYRLANALIKANKIFDFLVIPGSNHTDGGPYGRIKRKDFFVKHLLGVDPPQRNSNELLTRK